MPQLQARSRARFTYPPEVWDSLSKLWLTTDALRELNRRNTQNELNRSSQRSQARLTHLSTNDFLQHCTEEKLKSIKSFARHGGPDLLDLRGYPQPNPPFSLSMHQSKRRPLKRKLSTESPFPSLKRSTNPPSHTASPDISNMTDSSGVYKPQFEQLLIDNGIYPDGYQYPNGREPPEPNNWDEINQVLTNRRLSLSSATITEGKFREFKRANIQVSKENKVTRKVIPMIQGAIRDERCVEGEIWFTNLADLIPIELPKAKPDLYYGARPEQLYRHIRNQLSRHIVPSTTEHLPLAPNFFLEAKGPDGSTAVALRQVLQDGALGARSIHTLQTYGQADPIFDNNAYTITSTYHAGTLKMYTHYMAQPNDPGARPEYYMHQLNGWLMTGNHEAFVKGLTAFRNARDWTEAQRNAVIEHANAQAHVLSRDGNGERDRMEAEDGIDIEDIMDVEDRIDIEDGMDIEDGFRPENDRSCNFM